MLDIADKFRALATSMLVKLWMAAFNRTLGNRIVPKRSSPRRRTPKASSPRAPGLGGGAYFADDRLLTSMAGQAGCGHLHLHQRHGLVRDAISPLLGQAPDPKLVQGNPR